MKEFRQVKREIPNDYYRYKFSYISGGFEYYFDANGNRQKEPINENSESWQGATRDSSNFILTTN